MVALPKTAPKLYKIEPLHGTNYNVGLKNCSSVLSNLRSTTFSPLTSLTTAK